MRRGGCPEMSFATYTLAGTPCATQPVVYVLDEDNSLAIVNGTCYAEIEASPTGFEELWYGDSDDPADNAVSWVDGVATFSGLYIND